MSSDFSIKLVTWQNAASQIKPIRETVFIDEQHVPVDLEWDDLDQDACHVLVCLGDEGIGTARLLNDGHIGRMSVLPDYRGMGLGSKMLTLLIDKARELALDIVVLSAQLHAIPFYQTHGFHVVSDSYMDAGIVHKDMERQL